MDESHYVDLTEIARAHNLRGDGPVFALYATIESIYADVEPCARRLTVEEDALIQAIRRRTFALWEEGVRPPRGGQGAVLHPVDDGQAARQGRPKDGSPLPPDA